MALYLCGKTYLQTLKNLTLKYLVMRKTILLFCAVLLLCSCTPHESPVIEDDQGSGIILNTTVINLSVGNTWQIDASSETAITYQSGDPFIARVSVTGLVAANHVGSTSVRLDNGNEIKDITVHVNPVYNLYPDPVLDFGITRTALVQKLGAPYKETDAGISYYNYSTAAPYVIYLFDENNRLEFTAVIVKTEYTTPLASHLDERYLYYGTDGDYYYFINAMTMDEASMGIVLSLDNVDFWQVMYLPFTETKSATIKNYRRMTSKINAFLINLALNELYSEKAD